jgi:hypothetical protein
MEVKYTLASKDSNALKDKILFQKYTVFDKFGYVTESTLYQSGAEYIKSSYIFGPEGKPVGMHEVMADGTPNLNVVYAYDDEGYITEAAYQWENNHHIGDICDNSDYYNEILQNELFAKVLYKTDYRGLVTEERYVKADGTISYSFLSKYDPRGNKLESSYFHGNGRLSWMNKYVYDRYDNLTESRLFKSNRIAVQSYYKHRFDETGNWIVRREAREVYVNILTAGLEQADMLTERTIEYY